MAIRPTQKPLSPDTRRLLEMLRQRPGAFGKFFSADPRADIIRTIGASGEIAVVPNLLPFALDSNKEIAREAVRTIERLLQMLGPADYVHFDEFVREADIDWQRRQETWSDLRVHDVERAARLPEGAVFVLGVLSSYGSGYIREVAVRELGKTHTGEELPYLLIRSNDWVGIVRECARELLIARIKPESTALFLRWLPLVLRLRATQRGQPGEIVDRITSMLEAEEMRSLVVARRDSQDLLDRR